MKASEFAAAIRSRVNEVGQRAAWKEIEAIMGTLSIEQRGSVIAIASDAGVIKKSAARALMFKFVPKHNRQDALLGFCKTRKELSDAR